MCCPSGSANRAWTRRAPQFPRLPRASAVAVIAASVVAVAASVVAVGAAAVTGTLTVRLGARRLLVRPRGTGDRALRAPERRPVGRAPPAARPAGHLGTTHSPAARFHRAT